MCEKILDAWEISQDKISAVVTDRGANIVRAAKKLFSNEKHLYCFAQILNLIVIKSFNDNKNLNSTLKKIMT